jgi:hypothetical protein
LLKLEIGWSFALVLSKGTFLFLGLLGLLPGSRCLGIGESITATNKSTNKLAKHITSTGGRSLLRKVSAWKWRPKKQHVWDSKGKVEDEP